MNIMKKKTCGILLYDSKKNFLSVYPFGNSGSQWNIPKGLNEGTESYLETAIREFKEETSLDIMNYTDEIKFMGIFEYSKTKDFCFYTAKLKGSFPDINECHCISFFEIGGKEFPEISDYAILNFDKDKDLIFHRFIKVMNNSRVFQ